MSTPTSPFRAWLHQQLERQDPVGDLARDVASDAAAGCLLDASAAGLRRHVADEHDASPAAVAAVDLALNEWRHVRRRA